MGRIGQDFWYQSADAWSESAAVRRSNLGSEPRGTSFWAQGYGGTDKRGERRDVDIFGSVSEVNLRFETERRGAQAGIDFSPGAGRLAIGVTGGYERARSDFASGTRVVLDGYNIGAYLLYGGPSGLYAELLAKADYFDARIANGNLFAGGTIDGKSYGAEGELGYRVLTDALHVDLNAGLAYVRTSLDPFVSSGFRFDFDRSDSLRGRIGARVGGTGSFAPYADVKLLHEFKGKNDTTLGSGGFNLGLADRATGTWYRGEIGLTGAPDRSGGFVSAWAEAGDVKGYGVRLGFRF
jgi:trimeric autotransporter adhesin